MKLRNKKTGVDGELHYEPDKEYHFTVATDDPADMAIYRTLAALNKDWEDYKPAEPLIKDEKIRKAVRAWAELNSIYSVFVEIPNIHGNARTILSAHKGYVEWMLCVGMPELENCKTYTIAELCGEEEE